MKLQNPKILVTVGPASLNKKFLKFCINNVSLLRLNMSHIKISNLSPIISFIRKHNKKTPICIDTEGAQLRTKIKKKIFLKKNNTFYLYNFLKKNSLYPEEAFYLLKKNDVLLIGFENLSAQVIKIFSDRILLKTLTSGFLEGNKGVHLKNRKLNLSFLTKKDIEAISIAKKNKISNFALSFTNTANDVKNFKKIIKTENKIYKLETLSAIKDLKNILNEGDQFLIDRGDLSKEVEIEKIPFFQRKIIKESEKFKNKKQIFIATNLLESMVNNINPTRAEANDIFSCLELGAAGLVLAAETAIGKYPIESIIFLKKIIKEYKKFINVKKNKFK